MSRQALNEQFLRTSFLSGAQTHLTSRKCRRQYEKQPRLGRATNGGISSKPERGARADSRRGWSRKAPSWAVSAPAISSQSGASSELVAALTGDYGQGRAPTFVTSIQAKAYSGGLNMTPVGLVPRDSGTRFARSC